MVIAPSTTAASVAKYNYKIRDDSIHPREFLGTDSEDGIESILTDRIGHSLHEFIDGDNPLRPFIDFDLPQETLDRIDPKLTRERVYDIICHAFKSEKNVSSHFDFWNAS